MITDGYPAEESDLPTLIGTSERDLCACSASRKFTGETPIIDDNIDSLHPYQDPADPLSILKNSNILCDRMYHVWDQVREKVPHCLRKPYMKDIVRTAISHLDTTIYAELHEHPSTENGQDMTIFEFEQKFIPLSKVHASVIDGRTTPPRSTIANAHQKEAIFNNTHGQASV